MTDIAELVAENARLRRWLGCTVRQRLAEHLLSLATVLPDGSTTILDPPTQPAIARAIGAVREHVCREFVKLEREGRVFQLRRGLGKSPRSPIIIEPALLAQITGETP